MKKVLLVLFILFLSIPTFAIELKYDVKMVSGGTGHYLQKYSVQNNQFCRLSSYSYTIKQDINNKSCFTLIKDNNGYKALGNSVFYILKNDLSKFKMYSSSLDGKYEIWSGVLIK